MRAIARYAFYGAMCLYTLYNCFWIAGTMFSFGRNDDQGELIFVALTFSADIPILWWAAKSIRAGSLCLIVIVIVSMCLARSEHILNGFTLLYWYCPKLLAWLTAAWAAMAAQSVRSSI